MKVRAIDVWGWAYSDFLSNAQRGVLAEYIVAMASGVVGRPRIMWDAVDVTGPNGLRIEVKSAAYLQAWEQKANSRVRFDIAPKRTWDKATGTFSGALRRSASIYVFALFETTDRTFADPLDTSQWSFFVCTTVVLDRTFGSQRSVGLGALQDLGIRRLTYQDLASELRSLGV